MNSPSSYGPYVHKLNRGGLEDIVSNSRLVSTEAAGSAGGSAKVRAHVGDFKTLKEQLKLSGEDTFIEFTTETAPDTGLPPGWAYWSMDAGLYLSISINGVYNGNGEVIDT